MSDGVRIFTTIALVVVAIMVAAIWFLNRPEPRPVIAVTPTVRASATTTIAALSPVVSPTGYPSPASVATPVPATIKVYVSGAVVAPGVYELTTGQRIDDALKLAGGVLPDADLSEMNLAARLRDEQRVHVPLPGEKPVPTSVPAPTSAPIPTTSPIGVPVSSPTPKARGPINLNTASLAELDALPGIGPAYAQRIIEYRISKGKIQRIEELVEAKVIPQRTFDGIKTVITVEP